VRMTHARVWYWLVIAFVAMALLPGCEDGQTVRTAYFDEDEERLGFYLGGTWETWEDSDSAWLWVGCVRYPDEVPVVSIDDSVLEPTWPGDIWWSSHRMPTGTTATYRIAWKGDTLESTVAVLRRIDSVRVGDSVLTSRGTYRATRADTSGYRITWEAVPGACYYDVHIELTLNGSGGERTYREQDTSVVSPSLNVPVAYDTLDVGYARCTIAPRAPCPLDENHLEPNAESELLYCYEELEAPAFEISIQGLW
jgi:hypothetical protein